MIKINLPPDFEADEEIKRIYLKLAKEILAKAKTIQFTYFEEEITLDTEEKMMKFLMAKDFYQYKLKHSDFIHDLGKFNSSTKVETIVYGAGRTAEKRGFYSKYKEREEFGALEAYIENHQNANFTKDHKKAILTDQIFEKTMKVMEAISYKLLTECTVGGSVDARHYIISKMNVSVCPYCNMNYTLSYDKDGKLATTADLDHFYVKSEYPEYSLCLYNFIPSCRVCNSNMKGTKEMSVVTHIYPHKESFENKADFEVENLVDALTQDEMAVIHLDIYNDKDGKIKNSTKIFRTEEVYQHHNTYAKELLEKSVKYNEKYRDELSELLGEKDIKDLIFDHEMTEAEIQNISLGKLKRDLLKQFGIY